MEDDFCLHVIRSWTMRLSRFYINSEEQTPVRLFNHLRSTATQLSDLSERNMAWNRMTLRSLGAGVTGSLTLSHLHVQDKEK